MLFKKRQAQIEDNTLIVFTSDHGDMDSVHKMEHKSVLYEESVRVPFIMSYRGMIPKGIVDDTHLVSNGPTFFLLFVIMQASKPLKNCTA